MNHSPGLPLPALFLWFLCPWIGKDGKALQTP